MQLQIPCIRQIDQEEQRVRERCNEMKKGKTGEGYKKEEKK